MAVSNGSPWTALISSLVSRVHASMAVERCAVTGDDAGAGGFAFSVGCGVAAATASALSDFEQPARKTTAMREIKTGNCWRILLFIWLTHTRIALSSKPIPACR